MQHDKRVTVAASEEQIQAWKTSAHDHRVTMSEWIRQTLDAKAKEDPLAALYGEKT